MDAGLILAEATEQAGPVNGDGDQAVLHSLLDAVDAAVFILDLPDATIRYCNRKAASFMAANLGITTPYGFCWFNLVRPELHHNWAGYVRDAIEIGERIVNYRDVVTGNHWRIKLQHQPALGAGDVITMICQNISEIAATRAELENSGRRYRALFEMMGTGAVCQGRDGVIIDANSAAETILGRSRAQVLGLASRAPEWDAIHADGSPFPAESHPAMVTLRTGEPQTNVLMGFRDGSGDRRWIRINSHVVDYAADGSVDSVVTTFHDVTDKRDLQHQLERRIEQLDRALEQSLTAMAEMIEMRDPYTAGHQRKVAALAEAIAREMGLDESRCRLVRQAGLIHDIGKIAVPTDLLVKPSRLTSIEFEIVKQHVEFGHRVLSTIDFAEPIASIVLQHHERLDGSGYPRGITGDDIVLEARILSVADVADAMAAHRPYRPALGMDAALAELEANIGNHYDADVVAAFRRVLARG